MKKILFTILTSLCLISTFAYANPQIDNAYQNKQSNVQVQGSGKVLKVLSDDNSGSRHQRFILKLPSNLTVLVAHNIDLSNKIKDLKAGDNVEFYGEYEWNNKGGVLHWTHKDPKGKHKDGWLKHNGIVYK
jgi:hypothetical protein